MNEPLLLRTGMNLVFFDGVCLLCNRTVQRLLKWDKKEKLTFATLQGNTAEKVLKTRATEASVPTGMVYVRRWGTLDEQRFTHSDAMLQILHDIGRLWPVLSWARFLAPRGLRNAVYGVIARNRYRWFGKREACFLPGPEQRGRFLD